MYFDNRHFADDFGIPYVFINGFFILEYLVGEIIV